MMEKVRTRTKRFLSMMLAAIMMICAMPLAFGASGNCGAEGDNVTWRLDGSGTMVISGTGDMIHCEDEYHEVYDIPWHEMKDSIKTVIIGDGVTSISINAFARCKNLVSVELGENVERIERRAFDHCVELSSIAFPDSLQEIGAMAFWGCVSLKDLIIPNCQMVYYSFEECTGLESVVIGTNDTTQSMSIGFHAFDGCSNLSSVEINKSVTGIEHGAFQACTSLKSITIPSSVKTMAERSYWGTSRQSVFLGCTNLEGILVEKENECFVNDADGVLFTKDYSALISYPAGNKQKTYTVPETTTEICDYAFADAANLESIIFPDISSGVSTIGIGAFASCTSISSIEFPKSLYSIYEGGFAKCSGLFSVTFSNDHELNCLENAFVDCDALRTVNITDISKWSRSTFENRQANPLYYAKRLYLNGESISELTIDCEYAVGSNTFAGLIDLTSVVLTSKNLNDIGKGAFADCVSLESVSLPKSLWRIDDGAFYGCNSLQDVSTMRTEEEWKEVDIGSDNEPLRNANIHYHVHIPTDVVIENELKATKYYGGMYDEVIYCSDCGQVISRIHKTTDPLPSGESETRPTESKPAEETPAPKFNFFQRIIQWFKDFFAKLFGR